MAFLGSAAAGSEQAREYFGPKFPAYLLSWGKTVVADKKLGDCTGEGEGGMGAAQLSSNSPKLWFLPELFQFERKEKI